jgi:hypothetical protein
MKGSSLLRLNLYILHELYHEIVKDLGMISQLRSNYSEGYILSKPMGLDSCNALYPNLPIVLGPKMYQRINWGI